MTDTDILAALLHKHRQSCIGRAARRCQGCEREARDLLAAGVTLAALRSTPAAPTHTPKVMEAEAGRLLVESARIRAARLGPDDAHELRHLWAAINAGNSDPCGETCHLDADAIARWTEQYPKVMGLVALRSTPTARKPDARSLADRITGVIAIPPDGEVEP